jgi:putative addiction module killer protein
VEAKPRKRRLYQAEDGLVPFEKWFNSLRRAPEARARILVRLDRAEQGNFGDDRSVGEGVRELRIDFGPGYRVYLGVDGDEIVLLWGGSKKTQSADIRKAQEFWRDYNA